MNKKQLIITLTVCVILAILAFIAFKKRSGEWDEKKSTTSEKLFEKLDVNKIDIVKIIKKDKIITLAKKDEIWRVVNKENYPADFTKLSENLVKLTRLKIAQQIAVGKSQLGRLELIKPNPETSGKKKKKKSENTGILVSMLDKNNKEIASLLLGKKHMSQPNSDNPYFSGGYPDGRYLMLNNKQVVLVSETLRDFDDSAKDWLNKDFYKIENIKSISFTKHGTNKPEWTISKNKKSDSFEPEGVDKKKEETESSKISQVTSAFNYFTFDDVAGKLKTLKKIKFTDADLVTIRTFDGFTYKLKIVKNNNKYYLNGLVTASFPKERKKEKNEKPEDAKKKDKEFKEKIEKLKDKLKKEQAFSEWVYQIPSYKATDILVDRKDIVKKKKEEKKKDKKDKKKATEKQNKGKKKADRKRKKTTSKSKTQKKSEK